MKELSREYINDKEEFMNSTMLLVARDAVRLCIAADEIQNKEGKKADTLESLSIELKALVGKSVNNKSDKKIRQAIGFGLASLCVRVYWILNKLNLCSSLSKTVSDKDIFIDPVTRLPVNIYPKAHTVEYMFYAGKLSMLGGHFTDAERELNYALEHCIKSSTRNRRTILKFLIPVKILVGKLPRPELLEKYKLHEFIPLVQSVRQGDVRLFNDTLLKYESLFISNGTYLVIEKMKTIVYRNLFRSVCYINNESGNDKRVELRDFQTALQWLGEDVDMDEVECILVNLVFKNYIKGYVSHKQKKLVTLSYPKSFPPIHDILSKS